MRIPVIPVDLQRARFQGLPGETLIRIADREDLAVHCVSIGQGKTVIPAHPAEGTQSISACVVAVFRLAIGLQIQTLNVGNSLGFVQDDDCNLLDGDCSPDRGDERDLLPELHRSTHVFQLDA